MNVIDLFCGVGGMSHGLEMAGFKTVLGVEKDPDIAEGFKLNHPDAECLVGDITRLRHADYLKALKGKKVDVIVGGPPCQGFSQKGKRLSLEDERNFLFRYFVRTVADFKPKAFVIENVPNLLSTAEGFFFQQIKESFEKIGYTVSAKIIVASDYGVPQNRRRAVIVGMREGKEFVFPKENPHKVTVGDAIGDLPCLKSGEGDEFFKYPSKPSNAYQTLLRKGSKGVHNHVSTNHSQIALKRLALIPENGGKEHLPKHHLTKSIYSGTWTRLKAHEQAPTITTRFDTPSSGQFTLPKQDRCLTVREAARIQSFPDSFIFTGGKSTQMLQVGNAVPPLMAFAIGKELMKALRQVRGNSSNLRVA